MTPIDRLHQVWPDAVVEYDRTAADCGYHRPWFVWSTQDDDAEVLADGTSEAGALDKAVEALPDMGPHRFTPSAHSLWCHLCGKSKRYPLHRRAT